MSQSTHSDLQQALQQCAAEPLHHIGNIQSHGVLLAFSHDDSHKLLQASDNLEQLLELNPQQALGKTLTTLFAPSISTQIARLITVASKRNTATGTIDFNDCQLDAYAYKAGDLLVLELSQTAESTQQQDITHFLIDLKDALSNCQQPADSFKAQLEPCFNCVADLVRCITGYDSVMIYRFDPTWDGEVIAQSRIDSAPNYLGNHFPASDVPEQARQLYLKNWVRGVADINASQAQILSSDSAPLDMTHSSLRSLSALHIEYLRNMNVVGSMSISLLQNGRLWGLIICHHQSPKPLSLAMRQIAILISHTLSTELSLIEDTENQNLMNQALQLSFNLLTAFSQPKSDISETLLDKLLKLLSASGLIMVIDGQSFCYKTVLDQLQINRLLDWLGHQGDELVFSCDALAEQLAEAKAYQDCASGLLAIGVSQTMDNCIIWLRPEKIRTLNWAGDYREGFVKSEDNDYQLSPRKSFAVWAENTRGRCEPWTNSEIKVSKLINNTLSEALANKRLLDESIQERNRLDFIINNTPALIGYWDNQLRNQFCNTAYSRWFGKTRAEVKGKHIRQVIGEELYKSNTSKIQGVMHGEIQHFDRFITDERTGEQIHTQLSYLPDIKDYQVQGFYVLGIDVTHQDRLIDSNFQNLSILESLNKGIVLTDINNRITYTNPSFEQLTGYSNAEILGQTCQILQGPETDPTEIQAINDALKNQKAYQSEILNYRKDGSSFWNELSIHPIFDTQGNLRQFVAFQRDITNRKHLETELISSEQRFRSVANAAPVLIWLAGLDKLCYWFNKTWLDFTGRSMEQENGNGWAEGVHPEDFNRCLDIYLSNFDRRQPFRMEYRLRRHDGEYRWIDDNGVPRFNQHGEFEGYIGCCADVTDIRNSKAANDFFNISHEIIYSTDLKGIILDVNQRFLDITGYQREEVIGEHIRLLKSGVHESEFYANMWQSVANNDFWSGEVTNKNKAGGFYSAVSSISTIRDSGGQPIRYLAIASDITAVIEKRRLLENLAYYDSLTTLPNRLLLMDRLEQAMSRVNRHGDYLAVLFIDLDGFKQINDCYGHEIGDQLLINVSDKMTQAVRETDTVARLGGDEFIVLLTELADQEFAEIPINKLLKACTTPISLQKLELKVSASIGVSFYGNQPQYQALEMETLIRQADQAMYVAKQSGKNRFHCFDDLADSAINTRHETISQIQSGLDVDEFMLYYQPKVNMRTGEILGVEALIRWQHPRQGLLEPKQFLPLIENHPVSTEIGEWVIDTALAQLSQWQQQDLNIPISINVDARHLNQHNFLSNLKTAISHFPDFKAGSLEIEILETSAIFDRNTVNQLIADCQALGVEFALDDFGIGYSSLNYLRQLPVKTIKIDRSFVCDMDKNLEDLAIIESLIGLVSTLGRSIVAEGVESVEQGEILLNMGCEIAQGFAIAEPMPANQILAWKQQWKPYDNWNTAPPHYYLFNPPTPRTTDVINSMNEGNQ
jgi:diguanylate cyclase (GGDEF)-like protein/PAS domain S-box-containing protein